MTYTVESLSSAYGGRVPWDNATREEGLTERQALRRYNDLNRWYHPQGDGSYSGHVRIVGIDEWTYMVEPAMPGARATLQRLYHLDDLA